MRNTERRDRRAQCLRYLLIVALCAGGCAPQVERTVRQPSRLPNRAGTTLYLIEAPDDWLDDASMWWHSGRKAKWLGEQELLMVLRAVPRSRERCEVVSVTRPLLQEGILRSIRLRSGYELLFQATRVDAVWIVVNFALAQGKMIDKGSRKIPLGGSLLWMIDQGGHRSHCLIVPSHSW